MAMEFMEHSNKTQVAEASRGDGRQEDSHAKFWEDLHHGSLLEQLKDYHGEALYQPRPEYQNGQASKNLIPLERWVDDSKHCGLINQEQLATKLSVFAKDTDDMWHKMEVKHLGSASKDQSLTYGRFGQIFGLLDDSHRDKVLETLPWSLRPGE